MHKVLKDRRLCFKLRIRALRKSKYTQKGDKSFSAKKQGELKRGCPIFCLITKREDSTLVKNCKNLIKSEVKTKQESEGAETPEKTQPWGPFSSCF